MNIEPYSLASVPLDHWKGSFAADMVDTDPDLVGVEQFLDIDNDVWRVLHINISIHGGTQTIEPYAVRANTTYQDLQSTVNAGNAIQLTRLTSIEYEPNDHSDTNPPSPMSLPVNSATEFLGHGFKRLILKMTLCDVPEGARFEYVDLPDQEGSE